MHVKQSYFMPAKIIEQRVDPPLKFMTFALHLSYPFLFIFFFYLVFTMIAQSIKLYM